MISSENTNDFVDRAYAGNVADFISRPFDSRIVRRRVSNIIALYEKQRRLADMVEEQVKEREKENHLMLSIMSHLLELRNGESLHHATHIGIITQLLLQSLNQRIGNVFSAEDISRIRTASALHDAGKLSIPSAILNKPGKLTDEEFAIMKTHSTIGSDMIKELMKEHVSPCCRRLMKFAVGTMSVMTAKAIPMDLWEMISRSYRSWLPWLMFMTLSPAIAAIKRHSAMIRQWR